MPIPPAKTLPNWSSGMEAMSESMVARMVDVWARTCVGSMMFAVGSRYKLREVALSLLLENCREDGWS